jgi:hypothetical protein
MKIAIIIPAYNEERRIRRTLEEYGKFFSDLKKREVPNWLNFSLVVFALAYRAFYSVINNDSLFDL